MHPSPALKLAAAAIETASRMSTPAGQHMKVVQLAAASTITMLAKLASTPEEDHHEEEQAGCGGEGG